MGSFTAELHVAGHIIPLLRFRYGTSQSTGQRDRPDAKVRLGLIECEADVPDHQVLEHWAANPHKRLKAELVVKNDEGVAWETVTMPAAYCVGYREFFRAGDAGSGAYRCFFTLSDPSGWTVAPGGPANMAHIKPAAGVHGMPPVVAAAVPRASTFFRKNPADPVRDVLGPGRTSHPEEWTSTLAKLKQAGVEIRLSSEEKLAYAPATRSGEPGQIHLHQDASIGALRHEYQHFLDDQAAGYLGTRGLYNLPFRKETERKAYGVEIAMMEEMGQAEAATLLRQNLSNELARLEAELGDIEID